MVEEYKLKNMSEELVDLYLDECIEKSGMCKCPTCRIDVMIHALNHMPPRYVATSVGEAMVRHAAQNTQGVADILTAIINAINVVREHPRHDEASCQIVTNEIESQDTKTAES